MASILDPLKKYAVFQGRARRSEYWPFTLAVSVPLAVLNVMAEMGGDSGGAAVLLLLMVLGFFLPLLAVQVRRLHDTNRSGWWALIGLIPLVGLVVMLIFTLQDGTVGPNRFGPDPKNRTADGMAPEPMVS